MKLRLKITSPSGDATTFEHAGPIVRIGRESSCELMLEGEASLKVSRQHARIDLSDRGAMLVDLGSSNGTLLNDKMLKAPRPVRVGDRIQLGYTGATITILELDLQPESIEAALPSQTPRIAVGLGITGAVCALVAVAAVYMIPRQQPGPPDLGGGDKDAGVSHVVRPPIIPNQPPVQDETSEIPVGSYVVLPEWGPSVLLARQGVGFPWARFRPEARIFTSHTLVCLPGYRAHLQLDAGVHLTLWGNVPEFCSVPPFLLESVVMLNAPQEKAIDLDLILVRGRVHLANTKKAGAARIRLRFLHETWEVTLPDTSSEVCAELWSALAPPVEKGSRQSLPLTLGLFTKGRVSLRTAAQPSESLEDRTLVIWTNEAGTSPRRQILPKLPEWWTKPPDSNNPREADVMLALKDWDERLRDPGTFLLDVFKRCGAATKQDDPTFREMGVYFLGAFDEDGMPLVVRLLEDVDHAAVRRAAVHTLRAWLARNPQHDARLTAYLNASLKQPEKVGAVQRLLYPFAADELQPANWPKLREELLSFLDDENIAMRELAAWHLEEIAKALDVKEPLPWFDAGAPEEERPKAISEWKQRLP